MGPKRYGRQANSCFYFQLFLKTEGKKSGKLFMFSTHSIRSCFESIKTLWVLYG
ncbi:hypothetical protein FORC54_3264 [Vibrio vulnificus]|nr:hypothetical protein FORC54_3264 [Vibrio vulnificus]